MTTTTATFHSITEVMAYIAQANAITNAAGRARGYSDKTCSLCGGNAGPYGNNPAPLFGTICCDDCNFTKVLPARMTGVIPNGRNTTRIAFEDLPEPVRQYFQAELDKQLDGAEFPEYEDDDSDVEWDSAEGYADIFKSSIEVGPVREVQSDWPNIVYEGKYYTYHEMN